MSPAPRPVLPRLRVGLYLHRRGSIYHFRRRTPAEVAKTIPLPAFAVWLQTHLASNAMIRAARLLVAIEQTERAVMVRHE